MGKEDEIISACLFVCCEEAVAGPGSICPCCFFFAMVWVALEVPVVYGGELCCVDARRCSRMPVGCLFAILPFSTQRS